MKTSKLLVAAVLTTAIGAPIAGFIGEVNGQPMTSTGLRVPFLRGLPTGQIARQFEIEFFDSGAEAFAFTFG
jgi:hypothetical protein